MRSGNQKSSLSKDRWSVPKQGASLAFGGNMRMRQTIIILSLTLAGLAPPTVAQPVPPPGPDPERPVGPVPQSG